MRNKIIFLLVTAFFNNYINCGEGDLLSKFHQKRFKLKDFRVRPVSYDKNYINFLEIKEYKYNRTTTAYNFTLNMKINMGNKLEILVQAYKFLSNEYRHFPIRFQVNVKKAFDANIVGIQAINKCGNITDVIFYKNVTYHGCNFLVDETKFPPLVPNGKYKVEVQSLFLNKEIAMWHLFGEIYTPIYPKKGKAALRWFYQRRRSRQ